MNPGKNIRRIRKERNLSQKKLAQMEGISSTYLCDMEKGRCTGSLTVIANLVAALEVNATELIA